MKKARTYCMTEHVEGDQVGNIRYTKCLMPKVVVESNAYDSLMVEAVKLKKALLKIRDHKVLNSDKVYLIHMIEGYQTCAHDAIRDHDKYLELQGEEKPR